MFCSSPSVIPTHTPGTDGPSRATHLCVSLVAHSASYFSVDAYDPQAVRLDHFLAQYKDKLSIEVWLGLLRQIADVVRFAHDKKVVHRALSPCSILVTDLSGERPHIKIFNWQVGYRQSSSTGDLSREVTATSHVNRLVEDLSTAYMAPEALADAENTGEHLD